MTRSIFEQVTEAMEESRNDPSKTPYLFFLVGGFGVSIAAPPESEEAFCLPIDPEHFSNGRYSQLFAKLEIEFNRGMTPRSAAKIIEGFLDFT